MSMRLSGIGLTCIRGGREVFSRLDFEVGTGEALAVTGRNGSGKSSLLRMIAGLLPPAHGTIALHANPHPDLTLAEQAHYLGHLDALKPSLTVRENLLFWCEFFGGAQAALDSSLDATGLSHTAHLPAATLSAGQRRRLSMARLVAVKRPVWLLDEPTSALDADGQIMFAALMSDHLAAGGIIIAATHDPLRVGPPAAGSPEITVRALQIGGTA